MPKKQTKKQAAKSSGTKLKSMKKVFGGPAPRNSGRGHGYGY